MEVVARRDVRRRELRAEDGAAVPAAVDELRADGLERRVVVDRPLAYAQPPRLVRRRRRRRVREQRLADASDRPRQDRGEVRVEDLPEVVDVGDARDEDARARKSRAQRRQRALKLRAKRRDGRHRRLARRADVVRAHEDRHVLRVLRDRRLHLAREVDHLPAGLRVVVGAPGDERVHRQNPTVVRVHCRARPGRPRVRRAVGEGERARVERARDRIAGRGDRIRIAGERRIRYGDGHRERAQRCGNDGEDERLHVTPLTSDFGGEDPIARPVGPPRR